MNRRRVLVVDDDEGSLQLADALLQAEGYETRNRSRPRHWATGDSRRERKGVVSSCR